MEVLPLVMQGPLPLMEGELAELLDLFERQLLHLHQVHFLPVLSLRPLLVVSEWVVENLVLGMGNVHRTHVFFEGVGDVAGRTVRNHNMFFEL